MEKVQNSAKYRSLRWHYPDQVRSKFNTSSQTVHRLPYLIWTYDSAKQKKMSRKLLTEKHEKEFENKCFKLYIAFLFSFVPSCPFILICDEGNTELNGFFHGLFDQFFHLC